MKKRAVILFVGLASGCTVAAIAPPNDEPSAPLPIVSQDENKPGASPPPPVVAPIEPVYPKDGFCTEGGVSWAWCEDFDGQGTGAAVAFNPASSGIAFQSHSHMTPTGTLCETTSGDTRYFGPDTTLDMPQLERSAFCAPEVQGGSLFLNAEDGGFGMNVVRVEQPFDFSGREGRIHYRSDMKGQPRMHENVRIAPVISNTVSDLRFSDNPDVAIAKPRIGNAVDVDFIGDGGWPFTVSVFKDGAIACLVHAQGPLSPALGFAFGEQFDVDIYVSRTSVRVTLDGTEVFNSAGSSCANGQPFPDLGFDRGYVHFVQASYNTCKITEGNADWLARFPDCGPALNRFLWDDLAFDGPALPRNSLTPDNKQEVLFRAWNMQSCTVRGILADGPVTSGMYFDTWHVQLDLNEAPPTLDEIHCVPHGDGSAPYGNPAIADIQIVKR